MSKRQAKTVQELADEKEKAKSKAKKLEASGKLEAFHREHVSHTVDLTKELEKMTGLESRLTILGHLQRGGTPSAADRLLATRLGTACAEALAQDNYGHMIAARGDTAEPVPLEQVAGKKKLGPSTIPG